MTPCDHLVVGGGFFGSYLACLLKQRNPAWSVVLLERETDILTRASFNNQARIHQGYHYPRSFLTALSSRRNFALFVDEFREAVVDDFAAYYAIGRIQSHITAAQFRAFCRLIGAPIEAAPFHVRALFNPHLVEDVFLVREFAFNADILRRLVLDKLARCGVEVRCGHEVTSVASGVAATVRDRRSGDCSEIRARHAFICAYSNINAILSASGLPALDLKHEMTEMPLVKIPVELRGMAVTIMCGPFFSLMPFPARDAHSIHHVRYTPHYHWRDAAGSTNQRQYEDAPRHLKTRVKTILKDASRHVPCLAGAEYLDSIWEVKTILPLNERDDGRPILIQNGVGGLPGVTCVLGGKLDNVYDIADRVPALQ